MPGRQRSDQVSLSNSQETKELLHQKHKKIMAFPLNATFGQFFPVQMSFEAKLFSSPETMIPWLTWQQKAKMEMRTKATGLCTKSRRAIDGRFSGKRTISKFWIVRMPELKMLENILKPKETPTVHARKHFLWGLGRNWIKARKYHFFKACQVSMG